MHTIPFLHCIMAVTELVRDMCAWSACEPSVAVNLMGIRGLTATSCVRTRDAHETRACHAWKKKKKNWGEFMHAEAETQNTMDPP